MSRKKRHRQPEEHENHERWLISYADFITLLFAFFVVLYAISESSQEKTQEFEKSVKKYLLKVTQIGGPGSSGGSSESEGTQSLQSPLKKFSNEINPRVKRIHTLLKQVESYVESEMTLDERSKYVQDITEDEWGVRLSLYSKTIYPQQSDKFKKNGHYNTQ